MMKRTCNAPNDEPDERNDELPSEKEHHLRIVKLWEDDSDSNIIVTKLEVFDGEERGRTLYHRVNVDDQWAGFFRTRLFLKSIGEPYKGEFDVDEDNWYGKNFYATVVHSDPEKSKDGKIYANIDKFNLDKIEKLSEKVTEDEEIPF